MKNKKKNLKIDMSIIEYKSFDEEGNKTSKINRLGGEGGEGGAI